MKTIMIVMMISDDDKIVKIWTRTLDRTLDRDLGPGTWTRTPDPGTWTRTLDPGPGSWTQTLKNLDPEEPGP